MNPGNRTEKRLHNNTRAGRGEPQATNQQQHPFTNLSTCMTTSRIQRTNVQWQDIAQYNKIRVAENPIYIAGTRLATRQPPILHLSQSTLLLCATETALDVLSSLATLPRCFLNQNLDGRVLHKANGCGTIKLRRENTQAGCDSTRHHGELRARRHGQSVVARKSAQTRG